MERMRMESVDMTGRNIDRIAEMFPNCITEALDEENSTPEHKVYKKVVNFKLLRQMLTNDVLEGDEAYEFTWVGKKAAIVEANKPIRKTLRPCPEESVNWDSTGNLYIEGDNLEVLKLLQESYLGKIKMIYIDPPYNTGNDFIYRDDFVTDTDEYEDEIGLYGENGEKLFKNTDANGRFHSDWCSMIYSRLMLARNLLTDDGVIYISIDDGEQANLKEICDEVLGAENFVASFIWKSRQNKDNRNVTGVSIDHEYIICYSKKSGIRALKGADRKTEQYSNPDNDPRGPWTSGNMAGLLPADQRPNCHYDLINPETGINYGRPKMGWRYDKNTMSKLIEEKRIIWPDNVNGRPRKKTFLSEISEVLPGYSSLVGEDIYTRNATKELDEIFKGRYFSFPKPVDLIKDFIVQSTDEDSIVLDFFSGSGTTAEAVMKANSVDGGNRKFIMVQLPESVEEKSEAYKDGFKTICDIGKERIRRVANKYESLVNADCGFRVFYLDEGNMNNVYYAASEYKQDLLSMMESNIKSDRSDLDLLFGCILEWGLPLTLSYSCEQFDGHAIHLYNDGDLIACFEEGISTDVIMEIAKRRPLRAVFRDSCFTGSPDKINLYERFKLLSPDTSIKVI